MEIFLDSAKEEEIRKVKENDLIGGVTTNPKLVKIALEKYNCESLDEYLDKLLRLSEGKFFIQVENKSSEEMIEQARRFAALNKDRAVIKLPCNSNGLSSVSKLRADGISTCITALFTPNQAYMASEKGADYVAFYYDRFARSGKNGEERLDKIIRILKRTENDTDVVVGSLKNSKQVYSSILTGADIVTLPLKLIETLDTHELSEEAVKQFSKDWDIIKDLVY